LYVKAAEDQNQDAEDTPKEDSSSMQMQEGWYYDTRAHVYEW
jgi:hypothetical protein